MRIDKDGVVLAARLDATPTPGWDDMRAALEGPGRAVKDAIAPDAPFAVGLRIPAGTLTALQAPAARDALRGVLAENGYVAVTVDGGRYGADLGSKDPADQPDWRRLERLDYTLGLARLMTEIAPEGEPVSIDTIPAAFQADAPGAEEAAAEGLLRGAAGLVEIGRRVDRKFALAVEPAPCWLIETTDQAIRFFEDRLLTRKALNQFALAADLGRSAAEEALRLNLGLCLNATHQLAAFEEPARSLAALRGAGIEIAKLRLSGALLCPEIDAEIRDALRPFDGPSGLRQTVRRTEAGALIRHRDLSEALALGRETDGEEWRVRVALPVHLGAVEPFESGQAAIAELLALHKQAPISRHFEVGAWTEPPAELRLPSHEEAIAQELDWVRELLK